MSDLLEGIDAVIFDVDDTLVATSEAWQHAVDVVCAQAITHGICQDPARLATSYQKISDSLWSDYQRTLAPLGSISAIRRYVWDQALRACGARLPDRDLDRLVADFASAQLKAIRPDALLIRLIAELARGYRVAVCSNADRVLVRAKLGRAGLLPLMGVITCGMDERVRKPDPELLLRCCDAIGVPPTRCLHIGDDWRNDVDAASRAGLRPVWICREQVAPPDGSRPTACYATITQCLQDLLRSRTANPDRASMEWNR